MSKQLGEEVGAVLVRETLKADPEVLAKLMADHTRVRSAGICCPIVRKTGRAEGHASDWFRDDRVPTALYAAAPPRVHRQHGSSHCT